MGGTDGAQGVDEEAAWYAGDGVLIKGPAVRAGALFVDADRVLDVLFGDDLCDMVCGLRVGQDTDNRDRPGLG